MDFYLLQKTKSIGNEGLFYDNVMSVNSNEIKRPLFEEININYNSYPLLLRTRVWI